MTSDTKDVQLRIRARDESGKTLEQTEKRILDIEKAMEAQQAASKKGAVSAKELDAGYAQMARTLKGLIDQHAAIRNFDAQTRALEVARKRADALRQSHADLARQISATANPTAALSRQMESLTNRLATADRQQQRAGDRLAVTAQRLKAAGIATNDLAGAQARIEAALSRGNAALTRQAEASDRAGGSLARHGKASVTASGSVAGLTSRLAGLAAAYISIHQAAGLASKSTADFSKREGLQNQLALSVGNDPKAIADEYRYLEQQADRIGIAFEGAAKGYAKFAAAASMAGRSQQEIRYIFETFAEVGRVASLTTEDLDGVYRALEQMVSKGSIQAEELRGQLGDRLFGAFQVAADSLRDVYPDLSKALKEGLVTSDQLVKIAARYREIVAEQLPTAVNSLAANQARLTNAARDFRLVLADSGFADAYKDALSEITTFLKSADGKEFARNLSESFSAAASAVGFLVRHVSEVSLAIKTFAGLWAGMKLQSGIKAIRDAAIELRAMGSAAGVAMKGFLALQALFVGWNIGTYLRENFVEVRRFGVALVAGFHEIGARIKAGFQITLEELPRILRNVGAALLNGATSTLRSFLQLLQKGAQAMGRTDLANSIGRAINGLTATYETQSDKVRDIKKQLDADLAAIRDIGTELFKEADRRPSANAGAPAGAPTARPAAGPGKPRGPTDAELSKRATLIESLQRQLEQLDASIERSTERTLEEQLRAIDTQYAKMAREIASLGGNDPEAVAMAAQLARLTAEKKLDVTRSFNERVKAEHDALLSKLEDADAAAGRKERDNLDGRLSAISTGYADTFRDIEAYQQRLTALGLDTSVTDAMRERLRLAVEDLQLLERRKFAQEELTRRENAFRDAIANRDAQLGSIRAQREAGQIGDGQAAKEADDIQARYVPAIQAAAEATRQWAVANSSLFADPEAQAAYLATLDAVVTKATAAAESLTELDRTIVNTFVSSGTNAISEVGKSIAGAVRNTNSWADALKTAGRAARAMFADIAEGIAQAMIRQQMLNAILLISKALGWGGMAGASVGAGATSAGTYHTGGIVGRSAVPRRRVHSALFEHAPRLHSGGIAGLQPGEYAAVLKKNEEVITEADPRNILNGGGGGVAKADVQVINTIDVESVINAAGKTRAGAQMVKNIIRAHANEIKTILGN